MEPVFGSDTDSAGAADLGTSNASADEFRATESAAGGFVRASDGPVADEGAAFDATDTDESAAAGFARGVFPAMDFAAVDFAAVDFAAVDFAAVDFAAAVLAALLFAAAVLAAGVFAPVVLEAAADFEAVDFVAAVLAADFAAVPCDAGFFAAAVVLAAADLAVVDCDEDVSAGFAVEALVFFVVGFAAVDAVLVARAAGVFGVFDADEVASAAPDAARFDAALVDDARFFGADVLAGTSDDEVSGSFFDTLALDVALEAFAAGFAADRLIDAVSAAVSSTRFASSFPPCESVIVPT